MSKGTPMRTVRIPNDEWADIVRTAEFRNKNSRDEEDSVSEFIRKACREKIRKMDRSRGRKLTIEDEITHTDEWLPAAENPELFNNTIEDHGANA